MRIQPGFEFVNEAALSQACISLHNDYGDSTMGQALLQRGLYDLEFRFAPHHACADTFDAPPPHSKGARANALDKVGLQRFRLAFHAHRRLFLHIEDAAHQFIGVVRDEDVTPICRVDQTAGGIDGIAHRCEFALGADRAQEDLPTIHADFEMNGERSHTFPERFLHPERGTNRTFGIVFPGSLRSPKRHNRVANMFVDIAAIFLDDAVGPDPEMVDEVRHILRVPVFGESGEAGDIRK
jgi:hypothetical protein